MGRIRPCESVRTSVKCMTFEAMAVVKSDATAGSRL